MLALDTNVLVRLLTQDDPAQAARAAAVLEQHAEEDGALFVADLVLGELVWTLERSYGLPRADIQRALEALVHNATLGFESRETLRAALTLFARGKAGFADCLILAKAQALGCEQLLSFDRGLKDLPGVRLL